MALLEDDTVQFDDSTVVFHAKFIDFPHISCIMLFLRKLIEAKPKEVYRNDGINIEEKKEMSLWD